MQDFTKPLVAVNNLPTVQDKWLTKDRLWNFVFWFGMSFGMAVTMSVSKEQQAKYSLGTILIWATMICVPLLVRHFSKTSFIKKDTFTNSEGKMLTKKQMPYLFALAGLSGLAIAFIVAETILPKGATGFISSLVIFICLFSGISLYFIFKNCPISILFNRKYWESRSIAKRNSSGNDDHYQQYISGCRKRINSPIYQNLPGNVHYRHR